MKLHIIVYVDENEPVDDLDDLLELVGMILIGGEEYVGTVQS